MLEKTINHEMKELLQRLEDQAITGNSTENIKKEIIKFIQKDSADKCKSAYNKGYKAGKRSFLKDDWEYDPGDSRG